MVLNEQFKMSVWRCLSQLQSIISERSFSCSSFHWLYSSMHTLCGYWTTVHWESHEFWCVWWMISAEFPTCHLYSLWQPLYITLCVFTCVCLKVVVKDACWKCVLLLCLSPHVSGVIDAVIRGSLKQMMRKLLFYF